MNRKWFVLVFIILTLLMGYEVFSNGFSVFLIGLGILALLFGNRGSSTNHNTFTLIGLGAIVLAIFSSRVVLFILVVLLVLLMGQFPDFFQVARDAITKSQESKINSEFIMVRFDKEVNSPGRISRNKWFGADEESTDDIYSWSDVNFTKIAGDTIFDLGNTILPKEQNILLINKGFGKTKLLIPEGVAVSLDVSIVLGELSVGEDHYTLKNENLKWQSEQYNLATRKIKVVISTLVGEVEVVIL